ncbi:hypothetical protein POJ06DRAFT_83880 [Lipomyces tetrasporus]|uniref:Bromo domain-containing protein n=1 Tax=Lipomyces tetrasporus TaxID=54092 RepID=A0AAD7QSY8_9ASCO|nr:uncharacterized protein POJ06DRAFT_83880 [Lipomyces tetrasporus]KAJ8100903.1 hypothetical protein POJ06DRAFT_83880 [Lipomyces tetrasporus]
MLQAEGLVRQPSTGIGAEVDPSPSVIKLTDILHSRYRKELIDQIRQDEYNYRQYLREIEEIGRGEWDSRLQDLEIVANQQNELEEDEDHFEPEKPVAEEVSKHPGDTTQQRESGPEQSTESIMIADESANLEDLEMKDIIVDLPAEDLVSKPTDEVSPSSTLRPQREPETMEIDSQATIEITQETATSKSMIPSTNPPSEAFSGDSATQESDLHIWQAQNDDSTTALPNESTVSMLLDTTEDHPSIPDGASQVKDSTREVSEPAISEEEMRMDESSAANVNTKSAEVSTEFPDGLLRTTNVGPSVDKEDVEITVSPLVPNDAAGVRPVTSQRLPAHVRSTDINDIVGFEQGEREDMERTISPEATEISETGASRAQSAEPPKLVEEIGMPAINAIGDEYAPATMEDVEIPDSEVDEREVMQVSGETAAPTTGGQFVDSEVIAPAEVIVDLNITEPAMMQGHEDGRSGEGVVEKPGQGDLQVTGSPAETIPDAAKKQAETLKDEMNERQLQEAEQELEQATEGSRPEVEHETSLEPPSEPVRKGPGRPRKRGLRKPEPEPDASGPEENELEPEPLQHDKVETEVENEMREKIVEQGNVGQQEEQLHEHEEEVEEEEGEEADGEEDETAPRSLRGQHKRRYSIANTESSPQMAENKSSPATPGGHTPRPTNRKFQTLVAPLLANISSNKSASFFTSPVNENDAPDYHDLVYEPTDLRTIKSIVKEGRIQTSSELEREIMKMFANAVMYNRWDSDIGAWSREMQKETETLIAMFRGAERRGQNGNTVASIPELKRRKK